MFRLQRAAHRAGSVAFRMQGQATRAHNILVTSDTQDNHSPYRQVVKIGNHVIIADEPVPVGGLDEGPSPYNLLLSALGTCTAMTVQMYAKRKNIPLERVEVALAHEKVYAKDCEEVVKAQGAELAATTGKIDKFERVITFHGEKLTETDRSKMLDIANKCPVHRTLESKSVIITKQAPVSTNSASLYLTIPSRAAYISDQFLVKRILPYFKKRAIGAFVFLDHFAVDLNHLQNDVGPHPHIGLATLTYLFDGATLHRDSTGAQKVIRPGEVNYMISGKGVVHAERNKEIISLVQPNAAGERRLEGLQIWVALAKEEEDSEPRFVALSAAEVPDISDQLIVERGRATAKLLVGEFAGARTPLPIHESLRPMFLLDIELKASTTITLPSLPLSVDIGVYAARGDVTMNSEHIQKGDTGVLKTSDSTQSRITLTNNHSTESARIAIFGGRALPEPRHMFWNFVSTDKDRIAKAAEAWKALDRSKFPMVVSEDNKDSISLPDSSKH